eukprot:sb/3475992/
MGVPTSRKELWGEDTTQADDGAVAALARNLDERLDNFGSEGDNESDSADDGSGDEEMVESDSDGEGEGYETGDSQGEEDVESPEEEEKELKIVKKVKIIRYNIKVISYYIFSQLSLPYSTS